MKNLQRIRKAAGMSQSQLAQASGVNFRTIQAYESGLKDINAAAGIRLHQLAQALSCTIESLLELGTTEPPLTILQALLLFSTHVPWSADQCLELIRHIEHGSADIYTQKGVQYLATHLYDDPACPLTVQARIDQAIDQWAAEHPDEAQKITRVPAMEDIPHAP